MYSIAAIIADKPMSATVAHPKVTVSNKANIKSLMASIEFATKEMALKGKGPSRHKEDFGAAAENLLLAVEELGFATTWIQGQIENEKGAEIGKLLKVPEDYTVAGYCPIGEPVTEVKGPKKMEFNERCFIDEFGKGFDE